MNLLRVSWWSWIWGKLKLKKSQSRNSVWTFGWFKRKPRSAIVKVTFDEKGKTGNLWLAAKFEYLISSTQRNSTSDQTCVSLWNGIFSRREVPSFHCSHSTKPIIRKDFLFTKTSSETTERKITSVVDTASSPWTASCSALHSVTWCLHVFNFSFICCFYISLPSTKRIIIIILVTNSFHLLRKHHADILAAFWEIISLRLIYSHPPCAT